MGMFNVPLHRTDNPVCRPLVMLRDLSIRNFAIIEDLQICFDAGLTIMSGETGAGKSIIINAVTLLLGARASARLIRSGADSAELEVLFDLPSSTPALTLMASHGYNAEDGLLIRRIISRNDRHRVYINDRLATMQVLQTITENLASISSQHAHQSLLKEDFHLDILDQYGRLTEQREIVSGIVQEIVPMLEQRKALEDLRDRQNEQHELLQFQLAEIEAAQLIAGEDDQLNQERRRLRNAQTLLQTVHQCVESLYGEDNSVRDRLGATQHQLESAADLDNELQVPAQQIAELTYQLEDAVDTLRRYLQIVDSDEQRLEDVEARLDTLNRLKRKYGESLEDVMNKGASIRAALSELANLDEQIDS